MSAELTPLVKALTAAFFGSGVVHLVRPQVFEPMMPAALPYQRELVYASGVGELACAAGLMYAPSRRAAGVASAVLLTAVWPANIKMALDAHRSVTRRGWSVGREAFRIGTAVRVPLQVPLIRAAWRAGR